MFMMPQAQSLIKAPVTTMASAACASLLGRAGGVIDRACESLADASRTAKFLRGRLEFCARPDDIFVASYPRSGTTWTQLIVYLLCSGDHALSFEHLSQVSPWWERSLAWGNAGADDFDQMSGPRIFKSHLPYRWLPPGGRYIYVQRDGQDVALSYYHLYRSHLGYQGSFEAFFERFLSGDLQYGSWFKHVAGWAKERHNPAILFLSYEQLKRDPEASIARIGGFLGIRCDPARVAAVARDTSFAAMKANEDKFDHVGELRLGRGIQRGQFLRQGECATGRATLTAVQRARFRVTAQRAPERPEVEWRLPEFLH